jgi:hypothetical protein
MIDQDAAHQFGRQGIEMAAVLPVHRSLLHQFKISLVNKSRSVERMVRTFTAEMPASEPAKFLINSPDQLI